MSKFSRHYRIRCNSHLSGEYAFIVFAAWGREAESGTLCTAGIRQWHSTYKALRIDKRGHRRTLLLQYDNGMDVCYCDIASTKRPKNVSIGKPQQSLV